MSSRKRRIACTCFPGKVGARPADRLVPCFLLQSWPEEQGSRDRPPTAAQCTEGCTGFLFSHLAQVMRQQAFKRVSNSRLPLSCYIASHEECPEDITRYIFADTVRSQPRASHPLHELSLTAWRHPLDFLQYTLTASRSKSSHVKGTRPHTSSPHVPSSAASGPKKRIRHSVFQ
jgi:hypothetical protein